MPTKTVNDNPRVSADDLTAEEVRRMIQIARMVNNGPNKNPVHGAMLEVWDTAPIRFVREALLQGLDEHGDATETTREALIAVIDRFGQGRPTVTARVERIGDKLLDRFADSGERQTDPGQFAFVRQTAATIGVGALAVGWVWLFLIGSSFITFLVGFFLPSVELLIYSILSAFGAIALATAVQAPMDVAVGLFGKILGKLGFEIGAGSSLAKRLVESLHGWLRIVGTFGGIGAVVITLWLPNWSRWTVLLAALVALLIASQDIRHGLKREVYDEAIRRRRIYNLISYLLIAAAFLVIPITWSPARTMRVREENGMAVIHTPNALVEKNTLTSVFGQEAGLANGPVRWMKSGIVYTYEEMTAQIPGVTTRAHEEKKKTPDGKPIVVWLYEWKPTARAKLAKFFGLNEWYAGQLTGQEEAEKTPEAVAPTPEATQAAPSPPPWPPKTWLGLAPWLWAVLMGGGLVTFILTAALLPDRQGYSGYDEKRTMIRWVAGLLAGLCFFWLMIVGIHWISRAIQPEERPSAPQQTSVVAVAPVTQAAPLTLEPTTKRTVTKTSSPVTRPTKQVTEDYCRTTMKSEYGLQACLQMAK